MRTGQLFLMGSAVRLPHERLQSNGFPTKWHDESPWLYSNRRIILLANFRGESATTLIAKLEMVSMLIVERDRPLQNIHENTVWTLVVLGQNLQTFRVETVSPAPTKCVQTWWSKHRWGQGAGLAFWWRCIEPGSCYAVILDDSYLINKRILEPQN